MKHYEVLWYTSYTIEGKENFDEYETKEFRSEKEALSFYEKHKNDKGKYGWWITKRDKDWYVIKDIIW